ncbi:MAG TPA: glycosyl hydrolase-related protein, partial [Acidobacteriaceae bacterium]
ADEGHHEFTYSLYPHAGNWRDAQAIRRGYELNYGLTEMAVSHHEGMLPAQHSFVQLRADNVVLTAVKNAEDNDGVVLRFYEWAGKEGDVTIQLPPGARSASETDLMERPTGSLAIQNGSTTIRTKAYEIKTLKVQFADASGTGTK